MFDEKESGYYRRRAEHTSEAMLYLFVAFVAAFLGYIIYAFLLCASN